MAMGQFGTLFLPGADRQGNGVGQSQRPRNPVQEAVQVLGLRLPKAFGAQAIVPSQLATGVGGMGQTAAKGNVSAQALAALAGLPPSTAAPTQTSAPMAPPPVSQPSPMTMPAAPMAAAPMSMGDTTSDDDEPGYRSPSFSPPPPSFQTRVSFERDASAPDARAFQVPRPPAVSFDQPTLPEWLLAALAGRGG